MLLYKHSVIPKVAADAAGAFTNRFVIQDGVKHVRPLGSNFSLKKLPAVPYLYGNRICCFKVIVK